MEKIYTSSNHLSAPVLIDKYLYFLNNDKPVCFELSKKKLQYFPQPFFFVREDKLFRQYKTLKTIFSEVKVIDCNYSNNKEYIFTLTTNKGIVIFNFDGKIVNRFQEAKSLINLANSNLVLFTKGKYARQRIISLNLFMGFLNSNKISKISFDKPELVFNPDWLPTDNKIVYTNDNGIIKILSFNIE